MQNENYTTSIETAKSAGEVYKAINSVAKWWTENIEGSAQNAGDEFVLTFGSTSMKLKVQELVHNHKVVWLVTQSHKHFVTKTNEWDGTTISFEIKDDNGKIILLFNHYGLINTLECYDICCNGWNHYLFGSLKPLIETGMGNPDKR